MFNWLHPKSAGSIPVSTIDADEDGGAPVLPASASASAGDKKKRGHSRLGSRAITPEDAKAAAEFMGNSLLEDDDIVIAGVPYRDPNAPPLTDLRDFDVPIHILLRQKWRLASHDERRRCIMISIMVAVCVGIIMVLPIIYSVSAVRTIKKLDHNEARLSVWHQYAESIKSSQNTRISPCASLYDHSCDALFKRTNATAYLGPFADIFSKVQSSLLEIAEAGWPLVGTWFGACSDLNIRAKVGATPIQPLLAAITSVNSMPTLAAALAELHAANVGALFTVYASADELNQNLMSLYVDAPPAMSVPNLTLARKLAALAAPYMSVDELSAALQFEQAQLAPYIMTAAQRRQAFLDLTDYNIVFQNQNGQVDYGHLTPAGLFDWPAYFQQLLDATATPTQMSDLPRLISVQAGYMQQLSRLMVDWARADASAPIWTTLRAYLRYRLVVEYAWDLPLPPAVAAVVDSDDMAVQCLASVEKWLGALLGHYYVTNQFPESSRAQVNQMVENIIATMEARLSGNIMSSYALYDRSSAATYGPPAVHAARSFMDNVTLEEALSKLRQIVPMIGYPDQWDTTPLDFEVDEFGHLQNVLSAANEFVGANLRTAWSVAGSNTKSHWLMDAYEVNAYYSAETIVFPAGILQGPFFHPLAPLELNYGGLGVVIGHEIVHAFDDMGRLYDADGVRRNWFSNASLTAYQNKAQCIRAMYSQFKTPFGMIDGLLTLGENIADLGGLNVALQAYEAAFSREFNTARKQIEYAASLRRVFGPDLTRHKLFFAAYASSWCSLLPDSVAADRLRTDPHSPPKWRVNGAATQNPVFSEIYGCRIPGKKCELY